MRYTSISLFFSILLAPIISVSHASPPKQKWGLHTDFQYKMGNKRAIFELDTFIPIGQNSHQLFYTDVRLQSDDDRNREFGFGLGYRHMIQDRAIVGVYSFLDKLHTQYRNTFFQVVAGVEILTHNLELRTNLYVPEDKKIDLAIEEVKIKSFGTTSAFIYQSGAVEKAHPGFDAEMGIKLPIGLPNLWLYGGGFHFHEEGFNRISGPRARLELTIDSLSKWWKGLWKDGMKLSIGGEVQHDRPRGTQGIGLVRLTIP